MFTQLDQAQAAFEEAVGELIMAVEFGEPGEVDEAREGLRQVMGDAITTVATLAAELAAHPSHAVALDDYLLSADNTLH